MLFYTPQSINLINLTKLNVKSTPHKKARYLTTDCGGKCCRPYLALQCKCNGLQMARDTKTPIFFGRVEFVCLHLKLLEGEELLLTNSLRLELRARRKAIKTGGRQTEKTNHNLETSTCETRTFTFLTALK